MIAMAQQFGPEPRQSDIPPTAVRLPITDKSLRQMATNQPRTQPSGQNVKLLEIVDWLL